MSPNEESRKVVKIIANIFTELIKSVVQKTLEKTGRIRKARE